MIAPESCITAETQKRTNHSIAAKTIQTHNRKQPNRSIGQTISNFASIARSGRGSSVTKYESPNKKRFT